MASEEIHHHNINFSFSYLESFFVVICSYVLDGARLFYLHKAYDVLC